jgi:hypothetical protein
MGDKMSKRVIKLTPFEMATANAFYFGQSATTLTLFKKLVDTLPIIDAERKEALLRGDDIMVGVMEDEISDIDKQIVKLANALEKSGIKA